MLTQVLSGLGGVGKSQLAAAYARSVAGEVDVLVWVSATSRAAILSGYTQASIQLGLATDGQPAQAAARFLSWLQSTDRAWLVVLDDVADPADLRGLWPDPARGRTLLTTRRADRSLIIQSRRRVEVGLFSPGEARAYLAAKLAGVDLSQADELAADVGYLPLALAQAASFILNQGQTCTQYRARLVDRRARLARVFPEDALADEYEATVGATWSISVEAADRLHPRGLAAPLLRVLSMFDPNGVPADILASDALTGLLTATGVAADPDVVAVSGRDCQDAAGNLARFSLATLSHPTGTDGGGFSRVRVHALVQRAATEHLTPEQVAPLVTAAADALAGIWPKIERDPQLGQILRANTTALAARHPNALWVPERHRLLWRAGASLGESGLVTAAIDYWTHLATAATEHLGPAHLHTLSTRHNLARWRGVAGDPASAAEALEHLLTDRLRVLGPDHPDTLNTRHNLARWRGGAGDPAGAVEAFGHLLTDRLRVLGPDHPDTLNTRHSLAYWRGGAGDPAGAVEALEHLLTDRLRVLGPDHPDTLTTRHNLAYWRGEAGDPAGAVEAFGHLLTDRLRVLGPDHPDTLKTRHSLARWRGVAGDPAGATEALEHLLTDRLRVLGPDHPHTLTTRHNLAYWRGQAGDPAGAVEAFGHLLTDRLRVLGPDHPDTLNTRHNFARWRGGAGDPAGATEALEHLLTDRLRVLGPDHPDTLTTRHNLAYWRGQAGDPAGAVEALEHLLTDRLRVLGPDHPHTLNTRHNLAYWRKIVGGS